ncbi:MAG: hypothetical protein F9K29_08070 [Hyphomicrobiaceae bacterium]|nr:MAG: hypothetical protein F9K29_08070 [Hyphomicrobiaceae bacterium]
MTIVTERAAVDTSAWGKRFAALALTTLVASAWLVTATLAQQPFPWARFIELAQQKGDKDIPPFNVCRAFDLPADCYATGLSWRENDGWVHAFSVLTQPSKPVRIIISRRKFEEVGDAFYLTDLNGRLLGAVTPIGPSWAQTWLSASVKAPEIQKGFADEIAYWRASQARWEQEPAGLRGDQRQQCGCLCNESGQWVPRRCADPQHQPMCLNKPVGENCKTGEFYPTQCERVQYCNFNSTKCEWVTECGMRRSSFPLLR